MERGRRRIRLLIILAALVFSSVIFLTGSGPGSCGWPGNGGGGTNPPPPPASTCNQNYKTGVYNCNINITITNTAGHSQYGGVSVTVANPQ
jgi:hypothetical protein